MYEITEKQSNFLKKYLTQDQITKLADEGFESVSGFIGMIVATKNYDFYKKIEEDEETKKNLEKYINEHKENYKTIPKEYCSCKDVYILKGFQQKKFLFEQKWFKGMNNTPSFNWFYVDEEGNVLKDVYQIIFKDGIRSLSDLLNKMFLA